ncbi:lipid II:glycine glycyltransferase FemX [Cytobacillus sp. Hz8]|uniref:lipid II:glycine glycyltransferase FemX n=1 Tax=Cytobacillus sp. Hz8 TaxID=3347168 RepID=UPI0035DB60C8
MKEISNQSINHLYILGEKHNWDGYLKHFGKVDIYYTKEYVQLFAQVEGGVPEAIYFENDAGKVFYPYIKRKIDVKEGYYDIISPYGYGGPIIEGNKRVIEVFYLQFKQYCLDNYIITETVRFHPLLNNVEYMRKLMSVDYVRKTTAIDLTQSLDDIRKKYRSNTRRNIRKARRDGVEVYRSTRKEDVEIFIELYEETMNRNHALDFYYFDQSYFDRQMEETQYSKPYFIFAKYKEEIIAGVLLIIGKEFAHYHLGASKTAYLHLRPNNLLFDAMVEFSKSFGVQALHLGGGYGDNDSLFKFKSSFTNNNHYDYFLGKNVVNEEVYRELIKITTNDDTASGSNFFPIYRRKKFLSKNIR